MRLFIAGATGSVGLEVLRLAKAQGHYVHALSQSPKRANKLTRLADIVTVNDATVSVPGMSGIDAVVSCLGAPVTPSLAERRPYRAVDTVANGNLLRAAQAAGVRRFVYVSVHTQPAYAATAYIRAHEQFVLRLRESGASYTVIRPTGIFPVFAGFVALARRGVSITIGDGSARTNPIHQTDVAAAILANLESGPVEVSLGGPDILTRRQIAEAAFEALGKRARVLSVPAGMFRWNATVAGLANPRLGELFEFAAAVSTADCVAPGVGTRRLIDYFREAAAR